MTAKYNALRNLLEKTPKSLPAIKRLESWGAEIELTDDRLLDLAILLPRSDVQESLNRLKNAIKFADGYPTTPAPVLSIQETIDKDPWNAVKNLNALRVESGEPEPEPQNQWQAIIDRDPVNAPELLRAAALGRND